ncbi:ACP S-malonyltransferase [Ruania alkalisoli]|uniref:[acyl-carrier-protein] S-malonyltransferase n=1 Tax=Ruania alkalisoli TaxID=2779775 RepID=A0A7M1SPV7_9MICO|nr:ACP S-malonyltransferase [Ruania alkalisoli]QOR69207.1 ACP S-malonyltransferase [Ruania alkalisoli]
MIALLSPGQGAQAPGMLGPWLEVPGTDDLLSACAEAAGLDLRTLGTTADAETIKDTAVAQPLIVAASLLSLHALQAALVTREASLAGTSDWVDIAAGHSVGEFAAAASAGVLTPTDALHLVGVRGAAMAEAAGRAETGMSAVVGGQPAEVEAALAAHDLVGANVNAGGQVVAAGLLTDLRALEADPPARARVIPLAVAGAFHTSYMSPAVQAVQAVADGLSPADPAVRLLSNAAGNTITSGGEALAGLVAQISSPVRWDLCQEAMLTAEVTAAVELAPAGVLTGLARRSMRGVETVALKSPDDLDAAVDLIIRTRSTRES